MNDRTLAFLAAALIAAPAPALAQSVGSAGSGPVGHLQAGYGGARYTTSRQAAGTTRDANGNRLIVDGLTQTGASAYSNVSGGVSYSGGGGSNGRGGSTIGGSTAIGNSLNVVVQGNHNTVIVNSTQTNTGNVTAGTALNGSLRLP